MRLATISSTTAPISSIDASNATPSSRTTYDPSMGKRAVMEDHLQPILERHRQSELRRNDGQSPHKRWPYAVPGALLAAATLTAILAYVIIKKRRKAASSSCSSTSDTAKEQTVLNNSPKFTLHLTSAAQQQPAQFITPTEIITAETYPTTATATPKLANDMVTNAKVCPAGYCGQKRASLSALPQMRIKHMGLLERRGSNASLTIDVNPIVIETFQLPSPPKECSAIEFLSSAGNRLNRRQLKARLADTPAVHQEFLDIPLNHPKKLDLPGCSNKNRYKSIWPNEATRVVLHRRRPRPSPISLLNGQDHCAHQNHSCDQTSHIPQQCSEGDEDASSTYINANYITGYGNSPKSFIATQGPLVNTVDDFWSMVWQERSPCIVMMTNLKENQKVKCEPYLPTQQTQYGDILVTVQATVEKNGYSVAQVLMERDSESRHVKHFWFSGWPDHKAPCSTAIQLIELIQDVEAVRQQQLSLARPVVVHCSAGLGRTGCFVATAIGMQQLREENAVDILEIVCQMRMERGGMIQTVEQYEFLHHVLAQYERHLPETPRLSP